MIYSVVIPPVMPTTPVSSTHQSFALSLSVQVPLMVTCLPAMSGLVARYSKVLMRISGFSKTAVSRSIRAVNGPWTKRSISECEGVSIDVRFEENYVYLHTPPPLVNSSCPSGYDVH